MEPGARNTGLMWLFSSVLMGKVAGGIQAVWLAFLVRVQVFSTNLESLRDSETHHFENLESFQVLTHDSTQGSSSKRHSAVHSYLRTSIHAHAIHQHSTYSSMAFITDVRTNA